MVRYVPPYFQRQSNLQRVVSYDDAKVKHATIARGIAEGRDAEIERYNQGKSTLTGAKAW
jgi:hypothetical protein